MAERLVQDESLVSVAEAIRTKLGNADALTFPEGFVDAISAIIIGGGLPDGIAAMATGEYTPSEYTETVTITHDLGVKPNVFMLLPKTAAGSDSYLSAYIHISQYIAQSSGQPFKVVLRGTTPAAEVGLGSLSSLTTTVCAVTSKYGTLEAGKTYFWLAAVVEGIS